LSAITATVAAEVKISSDIGELRANGSAHRVKSSLQVRCSPSKSLWPLRTTLSHLGCNPTHKQLHVKGKFGFFHLSSRLRGFPQEVVLTRTERRKKKRLPGRFAGVISVLTCGIRLPLNRNVDCMQKFCTPSWRS